VTYVLVLRCTRYHFPVVVLRCASGFTISRSLIRGIDTYSLTLMIKCSKTCCGIPIKDRSAHVVLICMKTLLVEVELPSRGIKMSHFHSDDGSELIAEANIKYLHAHHGLTLHVTPRDEFCQRGG
jgi:hypothetical protein